MRAGLLIRLSAGLLLSAGLAPLVPNAEATLGGNWTLEMRALACPQGYPGSDFAADCVDVIPGISLHIRSEMANDWVDFVTGDDGAVAVNVTGPGTPHFVAVLDSPGSAQLHADCVQKGGDPIEHEYDFGSLDIGAVGQDGIVSCDWYFVPWEPRDALLTARVFNCPPDMTAETLVPEQCASTADGFDIVITSTLGIMEPYRLADATLDGAAYTWNLGPAPPPQVGGRSEFGQYAVGESVLPVGFDSYVMVGEAIRSNRWGGYQFDVSGENWHADLAVYNFTSAPPPEEWTLTVNSFGCPPQYQGEDWEADCLSRLGGVQFTSRVMTLDVEHQSFQTDESGSASLQLEHAAYGNVLTATVPDGYGRFTISCMKNAGQEVLFWTDGPSAALTNLMPSDEVLCDWYFVPEAQEEPANEPGEASIESLSPTPDAVDGLPAHVHRGTCGRLRDDPLYELTDLTANEGQWVGSRLTTVAEMSFTVIDLSIDELVSVRWSIDVHGRPETTGGSLVCGEIGGVPAADGSLAFGLREVSGSGYSGVAYLLADPSDPGRTQVWVFVASELAEEDRPSPTPAATPDATPDAD